MIPFKINEQEVEAQEGWTVLETAKQYGIHIPDPLLPRSRRP